MGRRQERERGAREPSETGIFVNTVHTYSQNSITVAEYNVFNRFKKVRYYGSDHVSSTVIDMCTAQEPSVFILTSTANVIHAFFNPEDDIFLHSADITVS